LLGHFRHEVGHYYWDALVSGNNKVIERFRQLFGDERKDYGAALEAYYAQGAPANWNQHFISPYATSHPWEDWAETWAHYLHMMDTLETAWAFGIRIDPVEVDAGAGLKAAITQEPYDQLNFDRLIKRWLPLCFAVNSLNRSMGMPIFILSYFCGGGGEAAVYTRVVPGFRKRLRSKVYGNSLLTDSSGGSQRKGRRSCVM